jgi:hypothetical protein
MARTQRTAPEPGRPSPLLDPFRLHGEPVTRLRRTTRCGCPCRRPPGTAQARASREAARKGNRSGGRRRQGVGGRHTSVDVGERGNAWTRPSQGSPCRCDLQKSPMPNALTLESRSPELVKGVETCRHEPHRRQSRMRAIRSSGSGEGPGRVTSRPTLQRSFGAAPLAVPAPLCAWLFRAAQSAAAASPERSGARWRTALRGVGSCCTGAAGWGRVARRDALE